MPSPCFALRLEDLRVCVVAVGGVGSQLALIEANLDVLQSQVEVDCGPVE